MHRLALPVFIHAARRLIGILGAGAVLLAAAAEAADTEGVFNRFAASVVQIRVVEAGSGAKAVIGSGFSAGDGAHVVTNYHVVSKLVYHPDRYRAEALRRDGVVMPLRLQAIDVVHDIAVMRADAPVGPPLSGAAVDPPQGTRLYALGYPLDLGLTIVEGTYNGFLDHTLYEKIHFTGSLNTGISGGPTITGDGAVVGVNVSTAGNEVSFLVPARRVEPLLTQVMQPGYTAPAEWLPIVRAQILAYQDVYVARLLAAPPPTEAFASVRLPGKMAPFLKCWADAQRIEKEPHESVHHTCSTDDYLFISGDQLSGFIEYRHQVLTTDQLDRFQFYTFYTERFSPDSDVFSGAEEELTRFVCREALLEQRDTPLKAVFCLRAYRKLPGLYDVVLKAAVLGRIDAGAATSLMLSGVSFENARAVAQRYLEAIAWSNR